MVDHERITGFGVFTPAVGQQDDHAHLHSAPPELRQAGALEAIVLDVFGFLDRRAIGHDLVHQDFDPLATLTRDLDIHRHRVEVSGGPIPLLSLPVVHGQLQDMAVGAMEGLVDMQYSLRPILPRRNVGNTVDGIT